MTDTASVCKRQILDYDNYRYQDWLRRRRMRLEQVRKQCNDLAKALRQRSFDERKLKEEEYIRVKNVEYNYWKATMLEELETKYLQAMEDYGRAYELATNEDKIKNLQDIGKKVNYFKAKERGEMAKQEEDRRRREYLEKKQAPIQRIKRTRKIENLRSALVTSVQKNLVRNEIIGEKKLYGEPEKIYNEDFHKTELKEKKEHIKVDEDGDKLIPQKVPIKLHVNKKTPAKVRDGKKDKKSKEVQRRLKLKEKVVKEKKQERKSVSEENIPPPPETIWINLNEIKSSSGKDSTSRNSSSSKTKESSQNSNEKAEPKVTFYDHVTRSYRKSSREYPQLVERIDYRTQVPPRELAKIEEEEEYEELKRKEEAEKMREERGREALYKEKIKKEYNDLLSKLGDLSCKERLLKTEQKIPTSVFYMNDERISERTKSRQKVMESKFERIFYDSTLTFPHHRSTFPQNHLYYQYGAGDQPETYLSFSPCNLKTNSPVTTTTSVTPINEMQTCKKTRKFKKKSRKKLLSDVDKALKEGKELRSTIYRNRFLEDCSGEDNNKTPEDVKRGEFFVEEYSQTDNQLNQPVISVEFKKKDQEVEVPEALDKEAQTDLVLTSEAHEQADLQPLEINTRLDNESLPVSTSTSYKSPPSVIRSCELRQFISYIEGLSDSEDNHLLESPQFRKKIKKVLKGMLMKKSKRKDEPRSNPTLEYYILKLLNMSREYVANLSVSSDNLSTPNITDLEISKNEDVDDGCKSESEYSAKSEPKGEALIREMRLKKAADWEEKIKNWKSILEKNINEYYPPSEDTGIEAHDEIDFFDPTMAAIPLFNTDFENNKEPENKISNYLDEGVNEKPRSPLGKNKYDLISQKCSERILELSTLLNKVRQDKEKLLTSTSEGSTLSLKNPEKFDKEEEFPFKSPEPYTFNTFLYSCTVKGVEENISNKAIADSNSLRNTSNVSSEPLPDVEEELLRREIITSPFKYGDGDHSIELVSNSLDLKKKPSIESVIGNFRKEMSKIKPFSLISADNYIHSEVQDSRDLGIDEMLEKLAENKQATSRELKYGEESSVESINNALTSLGLNWAKSFLKKNEKSRAMSSSSNSEESKSSEDEEQN